MDKHDWGKYRWWRTQLESYGDFSALDDLAAADVDVTVKNKDGKILVTLENKSDVVAFFVRMDLKDADGEMVVPATWTDNLVTLEPRQKLTYTCVTRDIRSGRTLTVSGWNVEKKVIDL